MTTNEPTYPNVTVELSGADGNAFSIIGRVAKALRRSGVAAPLVSDFTRDAYDSESYDDLLRLVMRTVDVV